MVRAGLTIKGCYCQSLRYPYFDFFCLTFDCDLFGEKHLSFAQNSFLSCNYFPNQPNMCSPFSYQMRHTTEYLGFAVYIRDLDSN